MCFSLLSISLKCSPQLDSVCQLLFLLILLLVFAVRTVQQDLSVRESEQ
jgi:hypothetical protein